jgi:molybdate transport system ATP-binding protein
VAEITSDSGALLVAIKKRRDDFLLDITASVAPGITVLFGASGAGKTTLLDCIAGLVTPDSGHIAISAQTFFDSEERVSLRPEKRRIGYIFQDVALFPHLTAEQNVQYGLRSVNRDEQARRARDMFRSFRIDDLREKRPADISGGERQRVGLARALVLDPLVMLLDEPLAALDASTKTGIIDDLKEWNAAHRIPILYVTHSREEVFALGERVLVLENGQLIAEGTPSEALGAPRRDTVAQLAGFENIFDATVVATHEEQGTMTCRIDGSHVTLETPLGRFQSGQRIRIALRAGDILLATAAPQGLSARNLLQGIIAEIFERDRMVIVRVDCGTLFEAHITPGARQALQLGTGKNVWLVIKTHSCHLVDQSPRGK